MKDGIQKIQTKNFHWVNLARLNKKDLKKLGKEFGLKESDLRDCLPPPQRSKIIERPDYLFLVLLYPIYNPKTGHVHSTEADFFITKDTLITIHENSLTPLKKLFADCQTDRKTSFCMAADCPTLLHEILSRLLMDCLPILNQINKGIVSIEQKIFTEFEKGTVHKILRAKTNIVNFRKAMQAHEEVVRRLINAVPKFFPAAKLQLYFNDLAAQSKEIWSTLENYKDTIDALHETNSSLIDFRINEIIKTLTIFSVIVFPLTLLAAIFGMNTKMPLVDLPYGFWIVVGLMAAGALGMLAYFKKKEWL